MILLTNSLGLLSSPPSVEEPVKYAVSDLERNNLTFYPYTSIYIFNEKVSHVTKMSQGTLMFFINLRINPMELFCEPLI